MVSVNVRKVCVAEGEARGERGGRCRCWRRPSTSSAWSAAGPPAGIRLSSPRTLPPPLPPAPDAGVDADASALQAEAGGGGGGSYVSRPSESAGTCISGAVWTF